ncbi:MAG: hypothetical protein JWM10_4055 [Myxococcaceae bacterium]|nr:hypothetical protein [Myxococcaceae bacterium]
MSERRSWKWAGDLGVALLVTAGYGSPVAVGLAASLTVMTRWLGSGFVTVFSTLVALAVFTAWVVATIKVYQRVRDEGGGGYRIAAEVLVLALLPAWGLALNYGMLNASCRTTNCDPGPAMFRVLGARGVVGLVVLHAVTALAFAVSRRRPAKLPPGAELAVHALLVVGVALQLALAAQLADLLWGLVIFPVALPVIAPFASVAMYLRELVARLRRRGAESLATTPATVDGVYRAATVEVPVTDDARVHRPTLAAALVTAPAVLGVYAVVMAAVHHQRGAALAVFTETCGHALSAVSITHVTVADCHYLCTVAARGTPSLVRPERVGRRNGHPILVNRQLAVANAFEDLLHTRWPRFGRLARASYDRVGLPVSRYITRTWMADAVFVAMKPFEWAFYATLLLLDRGDPEARIDRMYR